MLNYQYSYLIGVGIFFIIWLALFLYRKKFRKEMLTMSIIIAPLGPISQLFYLRDYWNPIYLLTIFNIGIEDILFSFLIGGIASVIYEEFFIKKFKRTKKESGNNVIILAIIGMVFFIVLNLIFKINSIYASSIGFLIIASVILFKRKDLIKNAIVSGILVTFIMFIFYSIYTTIFPNIIQDWWQLEKISRILILGIPIEELLWGFTWGFLAGPLYEFWQGKREVEEIYE
ncbi:hypothetical protein KAT36_01325 [Candidatus Pacearchaeota archaeon]|nr:hypothetical protein [Candidatus Pacearchaeota archaeon]